MTPDLYEIVRGPMMTGTMLLFAAALFVRVAQFIHATVPSPGTMSGVDWPNATERQPTPENSVLWRKIRTRYRNSIFGMTPFTAWLALVYHGIIAAAILFTEGHNVLLDLSWGIRLPSVPEAVMDGLTVVVLLISAYYLVRRAVLSKMKFPQIGKDFLAILVTTAPFATGFIAYHQWFDHRTVVICHILSGQVMIVFLLYSKLSHTLFFVFGRFLLKGEWNFFSGTRELRPVGRPEGLPSPPGQGDADADVDVDVAYIRHMLDLKKTQIRMMLSYCARCSNCAQSCFFYANNRDASYIPSHKMFATIGALYRKKGKVTRKELESMADICWNKCVLCNRCYCPIGLKIPEMIAWARAICRSQDVYKTYDSAWETEANRHG